MADLISDYYRILGVTPKATPAELKKAYHQLARQYHPDVSQAPNADAVFKRINEAYRILSNLSNQISHPHVDQQARGWQDWGRAAYTDFGFIDQYIASYFDDKGNIQKEYACLFNCPHCGSESTVFFNQAIISWENCKKDCDICNTTISIDYKIKRDKIIFFEAKVY